MAQGALTILDTRIHIPVISDILNAIGVSDISYLDLICWIAAVCVTVVYKTVQQSPPFPAHDDSVQAMISAESWGELKEIFGQSDVSIKPKATQATVEAFFEICHGVSAFTCFSGNWVTSSEAMDEAEANATFSKACTVIKIVVIGSQAIGDFLVPQDPVQNSVVKVISEVTAGLGLLSAIVFSSTVQKKIGSLGLGSLNVESARGIGAIAAAVLVPVHLFVTGWHFYELTKDNAGNTRSAAILGEVSNLASYFSTFAYALAVNDDEPDSRLIAIGVKAACDDAFAGLQMAESVSGYA